MIRVVSEVYMTEIQLLQSHCSASCRRNVTDSEHVQVAHTHTVTVKDTLHIPDDCADLCIPLFGNAWAVKYLS